MTQKRRKEDAAMLVEFQRAVSIIMDMVTSANESFLQEILVIENDLLIMTLNCMNEKRKACVSW